MKSERTETTVAGGGTHIIVCKNLKALKYLTQESVLVGIASKNGRPVTQGDALVARDILEEAGYLWSKDFYIKKTEPENENNRQRRGTR